MGGRVEVIVKVDETGHVVDARFANGTKKINPSVANASILAAKQWTFTPAALNGKPVPSEHSIVFQFQPLK
jgi:outer membrane biosynthesis protein TonB